MSDIRVVAEIDSGPATQGAAEFRRATDTMRGGVTGALGSISALKTALLGLGLAKLGQELVQASDRFQNMVARLNLVTGSAGQTEAVLTALREAAERSRTPTSDLIDLYTRNARALDALGLSTGDAIRVSETLGKVVAISGASGEQASAAMMQLSQALASGRFQGDEFRSVAENLPAVMQLLQRETGKSAGELRKLASEGKLTADVLASAFLNASSQVDEDFSKIPQTVGSALALLQSDLSNVFGEIGSNAGVTSAFVEAFNEMRDVIASPEFHAGAEQTALALVDMAKGFADLIQLIRDSVIEFEGWKKALTDNGYVAAFNANLEAFRQFDADFTANVNSIVKSAVDGVSELVGVAAPSLKETAAGAADEFNRLANEAHAAAQEIAIVNGLRGTITDASGGIEVSAPATKRPVTFGASGPSAEEKRRQRAIQQAREQLDLLRLSNELEQAKLEGETTMVQALENEIALRRGVSDEIRAASPALAAELEGQIALEQSLQRQAEQQEQLRQIGEEVGRTITSSIRESISAGKDLDDTFRDIVSRLIDMAAQTLIVEPLIKDLGSAFAGIGGGGGGGGIVGSLIGAVGSIFGFADGGVIGSRTTLATPGGFAVAGEAGPEAIMPLRRGSDGRLGVSAAGGPSTGPGGAVVNVTVNVAGDATDATVERFRAAARDEIGRAVPAIVDRAHGAVRRSIVSDPRFLERR